MIKKFYLTLRWEPNKHYHSGSSETSINGNEGVGYILILTFSTLMQFFLWLGNFFQKYILPD